MKVITTLASAVVLATSPLQANENPFSFLSDKDIKLTGFASTSWIEGSSPETNLGEYGDWSYALRPRLRYETEHWFYQFEAEINQVGFENSNWLRDAYVGYWFSDVWSLKLGRLANAVVRLTPPPSINPTINYPRSDFGVYATGLQLEAVYDNWNLIFDLTGNSSVSFQDEDTFSRLEFNTRFKRSFDDGFVAFSTMLSDDYYRLMVDAGYDVGKWHFGGAIVYSDTADYERWSTWGLVSYDLTDNLELHVLGDYVEDAGATVTPSLLYKLTDTLDIGVGYQFGIDDDYEGEDRALLRIRKRF